jgi:hypothetical protein
MDQMVCGFVLFGLAFEYFRNKEEKKEMKRRELVRANCTNCWDKNNRRTYINIEKKGCRKEGRNTQNSKIQQRAAQKEKMK